MFHAKINFFRCNVIVKACQVYHYKNLRINHNQLYGQVSQLSGQDHIVMENCFQQQGNSYRDVYKRSLSGQIRSYRKKLITSWTNRMGNEKLLSAAEQIVS